MKIEHRATKGLTFRDAKPEEKSAGTIGVLTGYAAVFNSDSVRFEGWQRDWVERIAPGAFKRSLTDNPDVVALWSHDSSTPVARTPTTLALSEDERGLSVSISLVDTSTNRDLVANVRAGIIDAMSFGFAPKKTSWEEKDGFDLRTLEDVDLFEVSPVVWPAYPETSIGIRSATPDDLKSVMEERDRLLSHGPTPAQLATRYWEQRVRFL
jgi:HK97 family phage prohead protease